MDANTSVAYKGENETDQPLLDNDGAVAPVAPNEPDEQPEYGTFNPDDVDVTDLQFISHTFNDEDYVFAVMDPNELTDAEKDETIERYLMAMARITQKIPSEQQEGFEKLQKTLQENRKNRMMQNQNIKGQVASKAFEATKKSSHLPDLQMEFMNSWPDLHAACRKGLVQAIMTYCWMLYKNHDDIGFLAKRRFEVAVAMEDESAKKSFLQRICRYSYRSFIQCNPEDEAVFSFLPESERYVDIADQYIQQHSSSWKIEDKANRMDWVKYARSANESLKSSWRTYCPWIWRILIFSLLVFLVLVIVVPIVIQHKEKEATEFDDDYSFNDDDYYY